MKGTAVRRMGAALKRRMCWRNLAVAIWVVGFFSALILAWPMDTKSYLRNLSSGVLADREGRILYPCLNKQEQWCFPVDLDRVSPWLIKATIAAEDRRFRLHPGVDPVAVIRAVKQNLVHGRVVSGASTLTMQLVKRTEGAADSLAGKALQALQAVRLELRTSKNEILEAYLNGAPYGLNLVGCQSASYRFFGKPASELTLAEAALLAGLPKSPRAMMPLKNSDRALERRAYVLKRMLEEGTITREQAEAALKEPLGTRWHALPKLAPHLARASASRMDREGRVMTTLDARIQEKAERWVRHHLSPFDGEIENAAVMVVDVESAEVLARVGSADFFGTVPGGQVDGCRAPRSPGSALKPFVYAMAMEEQRLYADEILADGPVDYGLYRPDNFDRGFRGLVSASWALKHSRNVPALLVQERVGVETAWKKFRDLGLTTLTRTPDHYGLGLALGGAEVRLEELTGLYRTIAALGDFRKLKYFMKDTEYLWNSTDTRMFSRGVCLKLYEMLEGSLPLAVDGLSRSTGGASPRVCWKTGTSAGHTDAWAFVFNRHYVVGVWVGNNDGRPSRRLVGAEAALPLAARIFRSLTPKNEPAWPEAGDDLREVTLCSSSGLPASPWCMRTRTAMLPRSQYLHRICDVHHPAPADSGDARAAEVMERWPGRTQGWDLAGVQVPVTPDRGRDGGPARIHALRILVPVNQGVYVLTGEPEGDRLVLSASAPRETPLHWYLNDRYLGSSRGDSLLQLRLEEGNHRLTCMNAKGVRDTVAFQVTVPPPNPWQGGSGIRVTSFR